MVAGIILPSALLLAWTYLAVIVTRAMLRFRVAGSGSQAIWGATHVLVLCTVIAAGYGIVPRILVPGTITAVWFFRIIRKRQV
ncbi:hypothetical protein A2Z33_06550 [Candidatus Gottesmanbacteria bacterium RBG_16_52_11]|uniref:Uncharacterized protein n=1 Tax=Candidatus Gottesmanbacteria bacterium RBG_16_52_11 TaxID=1798374 RepID=A0A1F5YXK5_9BACT|nr:MAG: hypothetical protein A2Z33_06550 [Candidatus Gottesmanbacteria bacterium RBG_16_52_11]